MTSLGEEKYELQVRVHIFANILTYQARCVRVDTALRATIQLPPQHAPTATATPTAAQHHREAELAISVLPIEDSGEEKSHSKIEANDEFLLAMQRKGSKRACLDCIRMPGENPDLKVKYL